MKLWVIAHAPDLLTMEPNDGCRRQERAVLMVKAQGYTVAAGMLRTRCHEQRVAFVEARGRPAEMHVADVALLVELDEFAKAVHKIVNVQQGFDYPVSYGGNAYECHVACYELADHYREEDAEIIILGGHD